MKFNIGKWFEKIRWGKVFKFLMVCGFVLFLLPLLIQFIFFRHPEFLPYEIYGQNGMSTLSIWSGGKVVRTYSFKSKDSTFLGGVITFPYKGKLISVSGTYTLEQEITEPPQAKDAYYYLDKIISSKE